MSLTNRHKYKYLHFTIQRAKDRRQKFHFCRLPFDVRPRNVKLNLSNNRSQKTSKCGKNISDTLCYARSCATFFFLPHFDVICDLLLNRRTATWNLFVK